MEGNSRIELRSCEAGEEDRNQGRRHLDIASSDPFGPARTLKMAN